ncbi:unnamed protein product [Agarophyton chilense]|eukprot:gb/GEZJ01000487.1/.p2 GENE.gb/GEZJ01000487.1/~~gb/GEZJ01000487.1/.p2  ORF type:complete len:356 (-),score=46.64 gb/GEZJ01000487.1/:2178-3245(-)
MYSPIRLQFSPLLAFLISVWIVTGRCAFVPRTGPKTNAITDPLNANHYFHHSPAHIASDTKVRLIQDLQRMDLSGSQFSGFYQAIRKITAPFAQSNKDLSKHMYGLEDDQLHTEMRQLESSPDCDMDEMESESTASPEPDSDGMEGDIIPPALLVNAPQPDIDEAEMEPIPQGVVEDEISPPDTMVNPVLGTSSSETTSTSLTFDPTPQGLVEDETTLLEMVGNASPPDTDETETGSISPGIEEDEITPPITMVIPVMETAPSGIISTSFIFRTDTMCSASCVQQVQSALFSSSRTNSCIADDDPISIGIVNIGFIRCAAASIPTEVIADTIRPGLASIDIVLLSVENDRSVSTQ